MMQSSQRAGMLFALTGFALLSCGDAVVKSMAGQWAPTGIASLRYTLGMIGLGGLLLFKQGRAGLVVPMVRMQVLRGTAVAVATVGFFAAISVMPLVAATAITFTSPMLTALLAAVVLGEPARRETWLASLLAFAGVLILLRPNFLAVGWAALLPLCAALGMSVMMIANQRVAGRASALAMQFFIAVFALPVLLIAALGFHLSGTALFQLDWPSWSVVFRCALVALFASSAHLLIYLGTSRAGAATIAPMTYVQLLVATLLGWALFGDHPDPFSVLGGALIAGGIPLPLK